MSDKYCAHGFWLGKNCDICQDYERLVESQAGNNAMIRDLQSRIRELEAERERFIALPTYADVTLARLVGAEAALRWAWKDAHRAHTMAPYLHDLKRDEFIQCGLRAVGGGDATTDR